MNDGALARAAVLVIDCQATGASPAHGALLEVAWARLRPDAPDEPIEVRRVALPEGQSIPDIVRRLTGIADAAVGATPADVWRELADAARDVARENDAARAACVIHFARFELPFLEDLCARFGGEASFPLDAVCAHEIGRRLHPDLPKRTLRALAGYLGHSAPLERRGAGHVAATAHVWRRFVPELAGRGIDTIEDLQCWLDAPAPRASGRAFALPRATRLALPDRPGVYRMLRASGDVLYVGKARSLKKRVSSHFSGAGRANGRALEMLTQVHGVDATETPSALEAALLEADEIKRLAPPYNLQLRADDRSAWFASRDLEGAAAAPDDAHPIGPLPSRAALASYGALLALASGRGQDEATRAAALGVPPRWAPDPPMFDAAYAAFADRHLRGSRARTPGGALSRASRALSGLVIEDEPGAEDARERPWTPERVVRHLERALQQGGALLRRARWLCLLSEATVVFREAGCSTARRLVIEGGDLREAADHAPDAALPAPAPRAWRDRQRAFDAARYDRMRVLATELRRVDAEDGSIAVRLGAATLSGPKLRALLRSLC